MVGAADATGKNRAALGLFAMLLGVGCIPSLPVSDKASIACTGDLDCPRTYRCQLGISRCVQSALLDVDPPRLSAANALAADRVALSFSEPMAEVGVFDVESYAISPPLLVTSAELS